MELIGKVALVTGAGSGLGRATCLELADRGAAVGAADINLEGARDVKRVIGDNVLGLAVDVSDESAVARSIELVTDRFGKLDIAVNCAGVPDGHLIVPRDSSSPLGTFRRVLEINLVGTFHVMLHAAVAMLSNEPDANGERGVIINTASAAAWQGQKGQVAYSASKAGIIGMMLPAAREFAGKGVRVVTIAPGLFETGMTAALPKVRDSLAEAILEPRRLGRPTEFGALVAHVVENPYLNATTIAIDAGIRIPNQPRRDVEP